MEKVTIYHNNRCSTSRHVLQILKDRGFEPEVRLYLKDIPTTTELKSLLKKLNIKAEELVRKKEKLYKEQYSGKAFSEDEWIRILSENPVLIQRPIVIRGNQAVIGRPAEKVLDFIQS